MKPFHRKTLIDACAQEVYIQLRKVLKDIGHSRDTFRHFKEDLLPFPYENLEDEDTLYFKEFASHLVNIFINAEMEIKSCNRAVCKNCVSFHKEEGCAGKCTNDDSVVYDKERYPFDSCDEFEKATLANRGIIFMSESVNDEWYM